VNVIDIHAKWFGNFRRFELLGGQFVPRSTGAKIGSSYREFREIVGSRNRGEIIKLE